ncbi:asparagine synthase (glutamine-hydrolyzing) [Pseudoalteromonas sp. S2755]|uniref:asparagine synthase (glutamine-hydrolyzing) n=1 Tax=Pseudoalteromonas sp. S2755 TaxID=2066523 RepID=UPI00110B6791|nr:asparagine synthase (glutamine-hydrolyzing) [Pseudoalteromonas sp. S2755]TMN43206.1 asparagine synthase (glutamine-hydrolyzing) [Pseudoalteromonas sp. S2755]
MCGIAGIFSTQAQTQIDNQLLVNMAAIQHHRGPDGFGYKQMAGVGFSHARLSIIDLDEQRGRQPFISSDKRLMLAHNGEFYDYARIRAELVAKGARFQSKSDSEIAMHLYQQLGLDEMLTHLRGEFAFALYDQQTDTLHLVRDRFGIKPLYYTQTEDEIVFGSELKVLFANPKVKRRFSSEGLFHQLIQVMVPGSTAFANVHQIKPGHVVSITRSEQGFSIEDRPYWDVNFPKAQAYLNSKDEAYYIDGVRKQLLEAVQLRLTADVPVGCYLSGGIDSCAILGLSSAAAQAPIKAFTIGFDSAEYDETPIAKQMAQATKADHHIMSLSGDELYGHFERTLWHTERTIYNTLGVAKYLMSQQVNESNYKVVMTGEGSDELFAGYPAFRKDLFLYGLDELDDTEKAQWQTMLEDSNKLFKGAMLSREQYDSAALDEVVGFTPSCLQPWLSCSHFAHQLVAAEHRGILTGYDAGKAIAETLDDAMLESRHPLDKAQYVWIKTMLEGQILTWGGDRVDMANSMEARPAFLDHHLAEFAFTIPPQYRIKDRKEKYVLREAMKGLLPEVLYEREKFAFMAPPAHSDEKKWAAMRVLADKYLSRQAVEAAGLLDFEAVNTLFELHDSPDADDSLKVQLDAVINHLLGVQILHKQFIAADLPQFAAAEAERLGWRAATE